MSVLLIVFGGAIGFGGAYWWLAQAPAPLPASGAGFDIGDSSRSTSKGGSDPTGAPAAPVAQVSSSMNLPANTLVIPSLSVQAQVLMQGIADGQLLLPEPKDVGLYAGGSYPGDPHGTVLIAGHVNSHTLGRGALYDLAQIQPDATIWVTDVSGRAYQYKVEKLSVQLKSALPQDIFGRDGESRLVLVTCGGRVLDTPEGRHYESNVIVQARPTGVTA